MLDITTPSPIRRPGCREQNASARLICLPPAGAGATTFYPLLSLDSATLEICPVALPGREDRFKEPMPKSIGELADRLAVELYPLLDRPYALLGYSMGSLLCWEVAQRWRDAGLQQPEMLFALAARAPHRPYNMERPLHTMESAAFREELKRLGGMPEALLADDEIMEIYEPILRNDLGNCETYEKPPKPPLQCPIHALWGDHDTFVSREDAEAWVESTSGAFQLHLLDSKHILNRNELMAAGRSMIKLWETRSPAK